MLGGDTVAPSGLYARLCHAFLVIIIIPAHLWHPAKVRSINVFNNNNNNNNNNIRSPGAWQHNYVSLLPDRGQQYGAERAIC